jgi:serine/threonine protein kinase
MELIETLKHDVFGRVELVRGPEGLLVRRVARAGLLDPRAILARALLARERRALQALRGLPGVPQLSVADQGAAHELLRTHLAGAPLHRATQLPLDYFEHLDELVQALHARGVCHNDLHKEPNILVGEDGRPALVDFQLSSVHTRHDRSFRVRVGEDLRHAEKHRARYVSLGGAPQGVRAAGAGVGRQRSPLAKWWRRLGKPVWDFVRGSLLRTREKEGGRPSHGPWPAWTPPLGQVRASQRQSQVQFQRQSSQSTSSR